MAQSVNLWGATYSDVPAIEVPKSGGGMALFTDVTDTTAVASDVAQGKYFFTATGQLTLGTASGGGGGSVTQDQDGYIVLPSTGGGGSPSATQHTIYFEFSDSTDATINAWYESSFISDAITATTPTTYGQKTVTLAQLDGVTWYEPAPIPLNTQLIDYTKVVSGYIVDGGTGEETVSQWSSCSDFTQIDPSMTFSYVGYTWYDLVFYDASKDYISSIYMQGDADSVVNDYAHGTLTPAKIPSTAKYVRINTYPNGGISSTELSLIRTA